MPGLDWKLGLERMEGLREASTLTSGDAYTRRRKALVSTSACFLLLPLPLPLRVSTNSSAWASQLNLRGLRRRRSREAFSEGQARKALPSLRGARRSQDLALRVQALLLRDDECGVEARRRHVGRRRIHSACEERARLRLCVSNCRSLFPPARGRRLARRLGGSLEARGETRLSSDGWKEKDDERKRNRCAWKPLLKPPPDRLTEARKRTGRSGSLGRVFTVGVLAAFFRGRKHCAKTIFLGGAAKVDFPRGRLRLLSRAVI